MSEFCLQQCPFLDLHVHLSCLYTLAKMYTVRAIGKFRVLAFCMLLKAIETACIICMCKGVA